MTTTLYTVPPVVSFSSHNYSIVQAGTPVADGDVPGVLAHALLCNVTVNITPGGAPQLVQVPSYYNGGTGAPTGDNLPIGSTVEDSTGATFTKKSDGTWVASGGALSGTYAPLASPALTGSPTVNGNALVTKPLVGDRVVYVSKGGSDTLGDGLTPASAFAGVAAALTALGSNAGTLRLGWGTWTETGLAPANGQVIEGVSPVGTVIQTTTNADLVILSSKSNVTLRNLRLTLGGAATAATALHVTNSFGCIFDKIHITGQSSGSTFTGQTGVVLDSNAGDNFFTDFLIANLGVGAQINSNINYFGFGKFATNVIGLQGGDPAGVLFQAGASLKSVTFVNPGTTYVNLNGTSQQWDFDEVWFDGAATNAVIVGTGTYGPAIVRIKSPQLTGSSKSLTLNACGNFILDSTKFGDPGSHPTDVTITAANCPNGTVIGSQPSTTFDFAAGTFPVSWTVLGKGTATLPPTTFAGANNVFTGSSPNGTGVPAGVYPGVVGGAGRVGLSDGTNFWAIDTLASNLIRFFRPGGGVGATVDLNANFSPGGQTGGSSASKAVIFNNGAGPSSTPSAGGVLYASAGALHYKGSSGTDTVIAPA